jgi:2-dehydro-3-deoxyphosphogalactonate aldolase
VNWPTVLAELPLVAILRGVTPEEVAGIGAALIEAGFLCAEVTLDSPAPFHSIEALRACAGERLLIGAGMVLSPAAVVQAAAAGARLIVSPNTDAQVVAATRRAGLTSLPGASTPSDALAALAAGADAIKLFPAETIGPSGLRAFAAALPARTAVLPVGGITPEKLAAWRDAGAAGFGVGSALFGAGMSPAAVAIRARAFVEAWGSRQDSARSGGGR